MTETSDPLFVGYAIETPTGTMDTIFPEKAQAEAYVTKTLGISMSVFYMTGWKITPLYRAPKKACECGPAPLPAESRGLAGMTWATPSEAF